MPVHELTEKMPYEEYAGWLNYFSRRPPEWRADYRVSLQLAAAGSKVKATEVFPSLRAMSNSKAKKTKDSDHTLDNIAQSQLFQHMMQSKGGKRLEL